MFARLDEISRLLYQMSDQLGTVVLHVGELRASHNRLEARVDAIEARLDRMDERFEQIDERFQQIDEHLERIDERFARIDERFARIDKQFARIDERFDLLEKRLDDVASSQRAGFVEGMERLERRIRHAVNYLFSTTQQELLRVHQTLAQHAADLEELKRA